MKKDNNGEKETKKNSKETKVNSDKRIKNILDKKKKGCLKIFGTAFFYGFRMLLIEKQTLTDY